MKGTILITPRSVTRSGHRSLERLTDAGFELRFAQAGTQPNPAQLVELLPGCVGYLAGVEKISEQVLAAATSLKVISRNGTGVDNIDLSAARNRGIAVRRTESANARGVAELALGLIFALARSIPASDRSLKNGGWERALGTELAGKTLGIVGCGHIGRSLARFAVALDMNVIAYDVAPNRGFRPGGSFQYVTLDDLILRSDVLSLHAPVPADGRPIIAAAAISQMKAGVHIVNTARAELIDRSALLAGLESGQIGGVALDVFDTEPPARDALIVHDRVICTPHVGGYTTESVDRAMFTAVENLLQELR